MLQGLDITSRSASDRHSKSDVIITEPVSMPFAGEWRSGCTSAG